MKEYTFAVGDVNHSGIYASWVVRAESDEQAVNKSRKAFEATSIADPIEVGDEEFYVPAYGLVLRINPEAINAENIIDVYELEDGNG